MVSHEVAIVRCADVVQMVENCCKGERVCDAGVLSLLMPGR